MTQTARPTSDITTDDWSTTPLWSKVNDASDGTYIDSDHSGGVNPCMVKLASLTDPVSSSGHIIYARAAVGSGSGAGEVLVWRLYQGEVLVGGTSAAVSRTTITTYSYTLSAGQADSITDYTDLRIQLIADSMGYGEWIRVYDAWMECPDAVANATATPITVAAVAAVPAPTKSGAANVTATTVAVVAAAPASTTAADANLTPTTVAGVGAVPAPSASASVAVTPSTVAATAAIGDNWSAPVTANTGEAGHAYPVTVAAVVAIPPPAITTITAPMAPAVAAVVAIPTPTITGTAASSPSTLAAVATIPAPTIITIDPDAVITPATTAAVVSVPTPTISTTKGGTAPADTVAATAAVPAPTITVTKGTTVVPATVAISAAVPAPGIHVRIKHQHRGPMVSALERKYKL
jgi:hypothetical protein